MRKKSITVKAAAFLTATALCMSVAGCASDSQPDKENSVKDTAGTPADISEESPAGTEQDNNENSSGMGRYVETIVHEGDSFVSRVETQILDDGQMVFLNSLTKQRIVSMDGTAWELEENEEFSAFADAHYPFAVAIAKNGMMAFVGMDEKAGSQDEEDPEFEFNFYIYNTDNTTKQIPTDFLDENSHIGTLAFDEQGTLYAFASGSKNIYRIDVIEGTAEKLVTLEDTCDLMQCRNNILMCSTYEKIFLYDIEAERFIEDETFDSFIKETYNDIAWTGGGYTAYVFLGTDNTIYVAGDKGLYRHVIGGGAVEQVIDGGLCSLGDPTNSIMAVNMNDNNEFFAAYNNGTIRKFAYDATVSSIPDDKMTVYSLIEDDLVRQTISAYQTQYPDMYIEYQIGMDEGGITREDALKKLNTQLLSGSGPDVIMLDGMNIDTYAAKGVLMELTDLVNEIDQTEGLYRNLTDGLQIDDKTYAVPAKFCIPVIYGKEDYVSDAKDYKAIADMAERARDSYPDADTGILGLCSETGVMKKIAPVCAPSWKGENGQLDQDKIREFLEQSRRLYDVEMDTMLKEYVDTYQQRMIAEDGSNFEDDKYFLMVNDSNYLLQETPFVFGEVVSAYTYRDMLSIPRAQGAEDTLIKLMSGQSSNVYHPQSIAGINKATTAPDAAKAFVRMMIGETVQKNLQFGLPVNKKAMPALFAYDESELGDDGGQFYSSFSYKDGRSFSYTIYPVNQDEIDKLEAWIAQLDTPYLSDAVLEAVVYAEGAKYMNGTQDLDTAVKAIADSAEIYLLE